MCTGQCSSGMHALIVCSNCPFSWRCCSHGVFYRASRFIAKVRSRSENNPMGAFIYWSLCSVVLRTDVIGGVELRDALRILRESPLQPTSIRGSVSTK